MRCFSLCGIAIITRNSEGKPLELIRVDQELTPVVVEYLNHEPVYKIGANTIDRRNLLHIRPRRSTVSTSVAVSSTKRATPLGSH